MKEDFTHLQEHVTKFTLGIKFDKERFDVFNKFGLLCDALNKNENNWNYKINREEGHQLVNLFDFSNNNDGTNIFISTSRLGFSFPCKDFKKSDIKYFCKKSISNIKSSYDHLFEILSYFSLLRFGIYYEFIFSEIDIMNFNHLNFFQNISPNENKIDKLDEIQYRSSLKLFKSNDVNYNKVIISFNKAVATGPKTHEIKYLLTTDFQDFFEPIKLEDSDSLEKFFIDKFESNYNKYLDYIKNIFIGKGK